MPLSRSNRIDRRRRVMLDAVAADSEFAVESVRAKKKLRVRESSDSDIESDYPQKYRDPGYSQAVRKTCQQRMVQLIPVRRGTLSIVLTCMWMLWAGLLISHYFLFARAGATAGEGVATFSKLPIAQLFHLRSPHSIAQWLTCQLWMLTSVAAWMIFQLRRHKLDDYRARYRIWVILAIAAAFLSFEASSSMLMLLGISIDGWARREIGYAGWPLVLATFASIIGVFGIRLCSELKAAPMSVVSWLAGLVAWGVAALLGTGLLKLTWAPGTVDIVVGGCLLGGILAVFQAAGIYLRQTYIHAQKRFLVRNGANLAPIQWKIPKLSIRRQRANSNFDEQDEQIDGHELSPRSKWRMPWKRSRKLTPDSLDSAHRSEETAARDHQESRGTRQRESAVRSPDTIPARTPNQSNDKTPDKFAAKKPVQSEEQDAPTKPKGRLFGFIPQRQEKNERLDAEPIREDDGLLEDQGLTKKRGWFGIGGNRKLNASDSEDSPRTSAPQKSSNQSATRRAETESSEASPAKRSFWSRKTNNEASSASPKSNEPVIDGEKPKRGWVSKFSKSAQLATATTDPKSVTSKRPQDKSSESSVDGKSKKPWLSFASKKSSETGTKKVIESKSEKGTSEEKPKSGRRGLFGMLDGLKLKPPSEESNNADLNKAAKPVPIKQGQPIPSTQPENSDEYEDDDNSGRPMSKADRKRLRRQNQDDRRAA